MARIEISGELFKQISEGNEEAFEELYYKTYKKLYAYLLSLTANAEDASDLMQETYVKIHGSCHMYKDQGTPMAWILKIARNLFLMKVRKKSEQMTEAKENIEDLSITFGGIENAESRMWMSQLFEILTEEERQIIVLHLVVGLKHREIAEEMDMPLGTVLSKYNRAIKKLKKSEEDRRKEDL